MMDGLRWKETDRNGQIAIKEKDLRTGQVKAPATKTSGVFKIVTDRNPSFCYIGASSQIETVFRDYMNWVVKGKAPKAIQREADKYGRKPEIFRYEVLEEVEDRAELNKRKKEWIRRLANNQPETVEEEMKIKMKELKGTSKQIKFADKIKEATLEIVERLPEAILKYSKNKEMAEKYLGRFEKVKKLFESYEDAGRFIDDWKVVVYTNNKAERFDIIIDKLEERGVKITWRILAKLQEEYFMTY